MFDLDEAINFEVTTTPPPPLPTPPTLQKTDPTFVPSKNFAGQKKGMVFKMESKGLGYYVDIPSSDSKQQPLPLPPPQEKKKNKKDTRLLDPNHPAFSDMTTEQVTALEEMLKLKEEELEYLPPQQRQMVAQFRTMYNDNPEVFKPKKEKPPPSPKVESDSDKTGKKKDINVHDPTKWLQVSERRESSLWISLHLFCSCSINN